MFEERIHYIEKIVLIYTELKRFVRTVQDGSEGSIKALHLMYNEI